jgi:hypothetical protein
MFSNKFDVGIIYVLKVGFIEIILKIYSLGTTFFFFKFWIPIFWHVFFCLHFSFFSQTRNVKFKKLETKKTCWLGGGGVNPII